MAINMLSIEGGNNHIKTLLGPLCTRSVPRAKRSEIHVASVIVYITFSANEASIQIAAANSTVHVPSLDITANMSDSLCR